VKFESSTKPFLGSRLLRHAMLPLVLTWTLGAAIAVLIGDSFTEQAFDRAMLDDAYAVGSHVSRQAGNLGLSLTDDDLEAVLFDQSEAVYFAVIAADGALIAGQPGLETAAQPTAGAVHAFSAVQLANQHLRAVRLMQGDAPQFSVVIAQTTVNRSQLLQRLLIYSVIPQLLLLGLLAWGLGRVIRQDLAPLAALQQTLDRRDAADLTPVPPPLASEATTREVERVGVAINALLGRVSEGVRAQREFTGNVAHEMRTPLAGIRALAEYGLAQNDPQVQREQLQAILASQKRASHLVDQLLALALADEARDGLALEAVELGALARRVVLGWLPRADQAGVDLGAQGLEQGGAVRGDSALIEGALANLIDNAIRHGGTAGIKPRVVTIELTVERNETRLSVVDNGPGIGLEERHRMLQRWARAEGSERTSGGVGLGLAIVTRYAELLGARLELDTGNSGSGLRASLVFAVARP
jgi:two-component system, OmpR family, sensor histidine kinase TctE